MRRRGRGNTYGYSTANPETYEVYGWYAAWGGTTSGVDVATGDTDTGDGGTHEVIAGQATGGSAVAVHRADGTVLRSFTAFPGYTGGVNVAAGDLEGDARAEIVVGKAGTGGAPGDTVSVFAWNGSLIRTFSPYGGHPGGSDVAVGRFAGLGRGIVTGAGPGSNPDVRVLSPTGAIQTYWHAYPGFAGGFG